MFLLCYKLCAKIQTPINNTSFRRMIMISLPFKMHSACLSKPSASKKAFGIVSCRLLVIRILCECCITSPLTIVLIVFTSFIILCKQGNNAPCFLVYVIIDFLICQAVQVLYQIQLRFPMRPNRLLFALQIILSGTGRP